MAAVFARPLVGELSLRFRGAMAAEWGDRRERTHSAAVLGHTRSASIFPCGPPAWSRLSRRRSASGTARPTRTSARTA